MSGSFEAAKAKKAPVKFERLGWDAVGVDGQNFGKILRISKVKTRKTHRISLVHELETGWDGFFRALTGFSDGWDVLKVINTLGPDRSVRT